VDKDLICGGVLNTEDFPVQMYQHVSSLEWEWPGQCVRAMENGQTLNIVEAGHVAKLNIDLYIS